MSFLAEDGKSNRVRSAVLAEQPSHLWSFGVGEELPFPQGGPWAGGEELPCAPAPPPLCRLRGVWEMLGLGSIYRRWTAVMAGDFFGGPCARGGMPRAECCASPLPRPSGVCSWGLRGRTLVGGMGAWTASASTLRSAPQHTCVRRGVAGGLLRWCQKLQPSTSLQQPASPSSSSLPPPAALLRGRGVQALYVSRGNFAGRGVLRRGGVCVKAETLTLEERLGPGAWWGAAEGQPGFLPAPMHGCGQESALAWELAEIGRVASSGSFAFTVNPYGQNLVSSRCGCQQWLGLP